MTESGGCYAVLAFSQQRMITSGAYSTSIHLGLVLVRNSNAQSAETVEDLSSICTKFSEELMRTEGEDMQIRGTDIL